MGYSTTDISCSVGVREDSGQTRVHIFTGGISQHAIAMLCEELWGQLSDAQKMTIIAGLEIGIQDKEHCSYLWKMESEAREKKQ